VLQNQIRVCRRVVRLRIRMVDGLVNRVSTTTTREMTSLWLARAEVRQRRPKPAGVIRLVRMLAAANNFGIIPRTFA
jgi:hypothetical protein